MKTKTDLPSSTQQQLLRNPDIQPTNDVLAKALGDANVAYFDFVKELANHAIQFEWRYYNDGKAWLAKGRYTWTGARGSQNETTVFWLSIWDGFFKVSLFVSEKIRQEIFNLPLDDETKTMITHSTQMGKLKFFPLVFDLFSNEKFATIFTLIDFKKAVNKR